ncbi:hypothetical protein NLI96_g7040 [Meripilus lineatus]|uniref:Beta-lactamase-related domain-containing protein n=1 Tax=Meripilus lineatus TaxID=2056292 RepID=A0AAD5YHK4_9APHY|nr:hypothetical protein NLI96_g7040 [Physisporinus lineatus]
MLKVFLLGSLLFGSSYAAQIPRSSTYQTRHQARDQQDTSNQYITSQISALAEESLKSSGTPGLSLGVVQLDPNTKALKTEFGAWGTWTEDGDKTTQDVLFGIGSCSKAFLSAAMGILMDDFAQGKNVTSLPAGMGSFTWKTKVQELFPGEDSDWELMDEVATKYTNIRDILSHMTGLSRHELSYAPSDTPQAVVRHMRYLRPLYEFRERWLYNNQMYIFGTHIISTYAGKPFHQFVEERIFGSLNMTSTTYSGITASQSGKFSQAFTFYANETRRIPFAFNTQALSDIVGGPGGIISNTVDMVKWMGMLLNNGTDPATGATIIPPSVFAEVTTMRVVEDETPPSPGLSIVGYGLGWEKASIYGHELIGHDGGIPGFLTLVTLLPSDGVGIGKSGPTHARGETLIDVFTKFTTRSVSRHLLQSRIRKLHALRTNRYLRLLQHYLIGFAKVFPDTPPPSQAALYGTWPRVWSSHIQVLSTENDTFLASFLGMYPDGYGKNTSPFYDGVTRGEALAQFDIEGSTVKGLAVFEDQGEADLPGSPPYTNLKEIAGVYYVKEG